MHQAIGNRDELNAGERGNDHESGNCAQRTEVRAGRLRVRVGAEMELRREQNNHEAQRHNRKPGCPRGHVLHRT